MKPKRLAPIVLSLAILLAPGVAAADEALELAEVIEDPSLLADGLRRRGMVELLSDRHTDAEASITAAMEKEEEEPEPEEDPEPTNEEKMLELLGQIRDKIS